MKTLLLLIGKTTNQHLSILINEYVKRIIHYIPFEIEIIPEIKNAQNLTHEQQKSKESDLLLKHIKKGDTIILLDEKGKEFRSVEFSDFFTKELAVPCRRLVFIVGGPYGFDAKIYSVTQKKISLSKMTFSHQMIRLFFVEQLYRALTISRGEPYHHE